MDEMPSVGTEYANTRIILGEVGVLLHSLSKPLRCEQVIMSSGLFVFECASQHSNSLWAVSLNEIKGFVKR